MSVFLNRKECVGDLFTGLEQVEAVVKNPISLRGEIRGAGQRRDPPRLHEPGARHQGESVYDDIVNVVSPGGFPIADGCERLRTIWTR